MTYFDTAYVLKCYVEEPGWEQVPVHLLSAHEHGLTEIYSNDRQSARRVGS